MKITHPGHILLVRFLHPAGISQNALGRAIGVPPRRINEIVLGKRAITADTAVRLGRCFGNGAEYWMRLQAEYEIDRASRKIASEVGRIVPINTPATDDAAPSPETGLSDPAAAKRNIKRRLMR